MNNIDMYLIDESESQKDENNIQKMLRSLENIILNIVTSVGFIIALVLIAVNIEASEIIENELDDNLVTMSDVHQGTLLFKSDNNNGRYTIAPTLDTDVTMKVSGMLVRTKLIQSFKNESSKWLEGVYVFPLPESAAVDHMKLRIGERTIEGQIKERGEAKKIYNTAKRAGKKASLIEQQRPNLFTNSVANIGPGETVVVEIEYQQVLKYDNGLFKLRFPTTLTPRYIPGSTVTVNREKISKNSGWVFNSTPVVDAALITPPQNEVVKNPISIHVELNAGFPVRDISSSYHKIKSVMHLEGQYTVSLLNEDVPSDRDFELVWQPELGNAPKAAMFTESGENEDYHFVMIMPPANSNYSNQVLARDVTYIIDTSGSMHGESMRQAKSALQLAITRLRSFDRFNVIEFDSTTNLLFPSSRFATAQNTFIAKNFVNRLTADGGTEMLSALQAALSADNEAGFIRQVIFLTDGSVGNEDQLFSYIKSNLGRSRLFTVAIGSSPNSHFMTKAAKFGRGTYTYIGKIAEVNQKMSELFSKLEKPVMQNLTINWPKGTDVEIWPKRLPDLYAGEPLIFTARITRQKNTGLIKVSNNNNIGNKLLLEGKRNLQQWQMELDLNTNKQDAGVGVLWARNKIASIMDGILEYRNNSTSEVVKDLKNKIIKLALAHHLVSKYTSLVAVDTTPTRPVFEGLQVSALANSIPRGTAKRQVVQGQYAQTATAAQLHIVIGLMLLLLCALLLLRPGFIFKLDYFTKQNKSATAYTVVS